MKTFMNPSPKPYFWAALLFAALSAPVCVFADEDIDQTIGMPQDGLVQVENLAGRIEFTSWDRAEVQIRGEAGRNVEKVEINATANGVQVRVRNRKGNRNVDGTRLYLKIPASASIEADTVSADISVIGNHGDRIMLNTVSGDLELDASPQQLELHSVSGDVEFEGTVNRSTVETVSGEIEMFGPAGEVTISTVSGDVSLDAGEVSRGKFESVSGDMTLVLSVGDGGRLSCDSMSGDVQLRLPGSQEAEFVAQSYSGDVQSEFGKSTRVSKGPGVMLQHREGNNGAQIRLETFSGDVSIRTK